ncbi:MAG: isoleucine--tRNA ligase [Planctomycetota bacterium]|nr:isoleucine--tRNA ligase [Planctomycetota bacterium]
MFEPLSREYLAAPEALEEKVLENWQADDLFAATLQARKEADAFVFYEGPPTANGRPGIHHVLARTLKDSVCRYWTMQGRRVLRKAGWDTHGLPVELEVEKQLGISGKPDIEKHGIGPFNEACRNSVFTYKKEWEELSQRIGYQLDYENPYVTFDKNYVESVWFLLSRFAANDLLYRGHKVLPWCGRCGTGLSSHEVSQGYKDIDDPSVWVSFPLQNASGILADAALVAWTTTPWTLPSNMGACVHPNLEYAVISADNRHFVLLESKADSVFGEGTWEKLGTVQGAELTGLSYEPLFAFDGGEVVHEGTKRHVVSADTFVSDEDGTGIVHLAPYGADDFRIAQAEDITALLAVGNEGRFLCDVADVKAGTFFRDANKPLAQDLKDRGRLIKRSQCNHSYPHCWRCDTPLLYFPSPAWFLKTTAYKDAMVEENQRIRWAPSEIGEGRFGEWLENNIDWALSRDRYWGSPLPVWMCNADENHWDCLGSFEELADRVGGLPTDFDPHRPVVDTLHYPCTASDCTGTMHRVPQVIDCWFDSGAMPLAQYHWPFENQELVAEQFPADFIAEGLDQTRGWFYTLHAISVFLTRVDKKLWAENPDLPRLTPGSAYKSVLVNGLLLDTDGQKMSKRLGNIVNPAEAIGQHGADAIRWGLLAGGAAHLSRRYDDRALAEVRRRVFGTLTASYDFFALYARTEGWEPSADTISDRPPLDRWILSRTQATAEECAQAWEDLEPSHALRALEGLIVDEISNWYIRRSRRRFWAADDPVGQQSAFTTLHEVLSTVAQLIAPVAPFLADALWQRLGHAESVHLTRFPEHSVWRDPALESAMDPILRASSLGRSVRERVQIRVRQPLAKVLVHINAEAKLVASPRDYEATLREELNVKEVEWVEGTPDFLQVRAKANFKTLGRRAGKDMKELAAAIGTLDRETLFTLKGGGTTEVTVGDTTYALTGEDVLMETLSVEGLEAAGDGKVTLGLVTDITPELEREGLAREVLNRIQTQRKESGLEVSDRIRLKVFADAPLRQALQEHGKWIADEVLAPDGLDLPDALPAWAASTTDLPENVHHWDLPGDVGVKILVEKA